MYYEFSLTVPAGTTEAAPVTQRLKLTAGIIHQVEFQFPAGCQFLVHARVKQGGIQIWPRNRSGNISGEFFPIAFSEFHELKSNRNGNH